MVADKEEKNLTEVCQAVSTDMSAPGEARSLSECILLALFMESQIYLVVNCNIYKCLVKHL